MAMKPACDVYGTVKDVKSYTVKVCEIDRKGTDTKTIIEAAIDLCPRGLDRLVKFVKRGVSASGGE